MGKRILSRRRGAAPPRMTSPSHLHHGDVKYPVNWTGTATVASIAHAVGRTCLFATLKTEDGKRAIVKFGGETSAEDIGMRIGVF